MNILITGSKGFIGKNLITNLYNIKKNKDRFKINNIFQYSIEDDIENLDLYCKNADFVFHFAGVNRSTNNVDFINGNFKFSSFLIEMLKKHNNRATVIFSSSIQASLLGRYSDSEYGKSKLETEELLFNYGKEFGVNVLIYRFPNVFGKWSRPNYNSVIATFCNNIANNLPIQINNENTELELIYIDDLVEEMLNILEEKENRCDYDGLKCIPSIDGKYCYVPESYRVKLKYVVDLLNSFKSQSYTLMIPEIPDNSFQKKLYSTYLSYLPKNEMIFSLNMNLDDRGSFTELIKTINNGQISVNISKPGIKKGEHWHNSKCELFIVVSGHALIQERKIDSDEIIEFEVDGDNIKAVYMLPGYTHNIINLSDTENLVTIMWSNEQFNPKNPDTFFENV